MQLKKYQTAVIADLTRFLELLGETANSPKAYARLWQKKGVTVGFNGMKPYQNTLPGVPSVCLKVPTGGGKTFLACNAVKPIFEALPSTKTKVVVWLVPSDAILTQTIAALRNHDHPYRQKLDTDFGSAVEIYTKEQLLNGQNFNPTVTMEQVCICVLSYDSFRGRKENLKARQENSNLTSFTEFFGAPETRIEDTDESALLQVLNSLNPLVIIDESHHAKSKLSIQMLKDFNPCFVLELTATPKDGSNIISYVDAMQLKRENMVKLPVIVYNRSSQEQVLADTIDLRNKLEELATALRESSKRYIRPIALFQAQPRGKEDSTTFEKLRERLVGIGIPAQQIAIRTADVNELKNVDLMSEDCPIRYIITVNALTAADRIIIPAQADDYSLEALSRLRETIETVKTYCNPTLQVDGILLTRFNGRAVISREIADMMEEEASALSTRIYKTRIRECTAVKEAQALREDIFSYSPRSNAAKDYRAVIEEIIGGAQNG